METGKKGISNGGVAPSSPATAISMGSIGHWKRRFSRGRLDIGNVNYFARSVSSPGNCDSRAGELAEILLVVKSVGHFGDCIKQNEFGALFNVENRTFLLGVDGFMVLRHLGVPVYFRAFAIHDFAGKGLILRSGSSQRQKHEYRHENEPHSFHVDMLL